MMRKLWLLLLLAAAPAAAQDAPQTAPAEPVPLFQAVCVNGSAKLSRKTAEPATYAALPVSARRALGATTVATRAEAEKLPAPAPEAVPNTIYRIGGGQLYLLVPSAAAPGSPLADSCVVLWYALGENDYAEARKLVLPDEESVPLSARPTASAVGASVAASTGESAHRAVAAFGGWVALRSSPLNPDPQAPGAQ